MRFARRLIPRKRWEDMSDAERAGNILIASVDFALVLWALVDLWHRPAAAINGRKRIWVLTSLIQPFGPIIYLLFGRKSMSAEA